MTPTEQAFSEAMGAKGFTVLRNGWPDFLCLKGLGHQAEDLEHRIKMLQTELTTLRQEVQAASLLLDGSPAAGAVYRNAIDMLGPAHLNGYRA